MNTDLIEQKGLEPLEPELKRIAALKDKRKLGELMGELEGEAGAAPLYNFGVGVDDKDSSKQIVQIYQGGLSLPDRDYYLVPHYEEIRKQYVDHVTKMLTLAGDKPEDAAKEAAAVMEIETALAKASMTRTEMRDPDKTYNIFTLTDFERLAPNYDFAAYFKDVKVRPLRHPQRLHPRLLQRAERHYRQSEPLDAWKSYFRWHLIHRSASNLPKAFFDENFAFFGKTLAGKKEPTPRWKQCTAMTDRALGEAVGQDWVKQNFPPAAKDSMDKLVAALDKSLGDDIELKTLPWMSDDTKKAAEEKLAMIRNKIGYPEKWRDYSGLKVRRDDLIGNVRNAIAPSSSATTTRTSWANLSTKRSGA